MWKQWKCEFHRIGYKWHKLMIFMFGWVKIEENQIQILLYIISNWIEWKYWVVGRSASPIMQGCRVLLKFATAIAGLRIRSNTATVLAIRSTLSCWCFICIFVDANLSGSNDKKNHKCIIDKLMELYVIWLDILPFRKTKEKQKKNA